MEIDMYNTHVCVPMALNLISQGQKKGFLPAYSLTQMKWSPLATCVVQ